MPTQKHIIKKQILELRFGSREEAVELQDEIGRIYQKKVVPVIDAYCSRYSEPDVIHRIDKLEIDIGRLTPGSLEKEFPEKVKEAIRKELPKKIPKTGTRPLSSHLELLRHFVKTGSLPWWAESLGKKGLEKVMEQLIKRSPEDVKAIISEAIRDETGLKRIIYQFSDPTLLDIVRLFSPGLQPYIADYKRDSEEIFRRIDPFRAFPRKEVRLEQWRGIFFGIVLKGGLGLDRVRFTRETLLYMASRHRMTYASLLGRMQRAAKALQEQGFRFTSGLPDRVRDIIKEIQPVESPERGPEEARDRFKSKERGAKEAREISFKEQDHPVSGVEEERHPLKRVEERGRLLEDHKESMTGSDDLFTDSDEIYIDNAGLVLLWPFLERFFENMGLMKARRFISLDLAKRGALMLQFLADGATEAPESAIPLNKVLCGIDMEEPVETGLDLTGEEQAECESLLFAVIQNWSALKSITMDGFRGAFLMRDGLLTMLDGNWLVRVEKQTHDVLLDKLPWGISIISLPWLDVLIHVEW